MNHKQHAGEAESPSIPTKQKPPIRVAFCLAYVQRGSKPHVLFFSTSLLFDSDTFISNYLPKGLLILRRYHPLSRF